MAKHPKTGGTEASKVKHTGDDEWERITIDIRARGPGVTYWTHLLRDSFHPLLYITLRIARRSFRPESLREKLMDLAP
jgi:hypothetical protein